MASDISQTLPSKGKKRRHDDSDEDWAVDSNLSTTSNKSNLSYTSLGDGKLQPSTSSWEIVDLEAVGVFYNSNSLPIPTLLDMIYDQSGMFGALKTPQKEFVEGLQKNITFSSSMLNVKTGYHLNDILSESQQNLEHVESNKDKNSKVEDFIANTVLMIRCALERQIPANLTKAVFVDLFKSFAKMCGLVAVCGSEWRTNINILKCRVSSEADVILMNGDYLKNNTSTVSVVSIVEVKNLSHKLEKCVQPKSNDSSSSSVTQEEPVYEEPEIFKRIKQPVLAQHGGELLVHAHGHHTWNFMKRSDNSKFLPGMIVIGTQVTITVLDYNMYHQNEITDKSFIESGRSCIYYSDTKDLLKKEDRDMVIEALVRMNNGCTP